MPLTPRRSLSHVRIWGVLALLTAVTTAFAATASASPARSADVGYTLSTTAASVDLILKNGSAAVLPGALAIRNDAGKEILRMPLSYRMEYREFPIDAHVAGQRISLIPSKNPARARAVPPIQVDPVRLAAMNAAGGPTTKQQRDDQALARFNQQLAAGMTISSLVGLAVGAVVGGVAGCVLGLVAGPFGCFVAGVPIGAGLGSIAGTIVGGGGSAIAAAVQYFQTINSPFVPPK